MSDHRVTVRRAARKAVLVRFELVACPFLAFATACSGFDGLKLAKSGALSDAGNATPRCVHAAVRPPPVLASLPGEQEFVVAVKTVNFGEPSAVGAIGFDLDGKCTGEGDGPSCLRPPWADPHPDGPGGRDNAVSTFSLAQDGGDPTANQNSLAKLGISTTVIRVRGYNGTFSDGSVDVALFAATRSLDALQSTGNPPAWHGTDIWKAFVEWTEPVPSDGGKPQDGIRAKYQSSRAYVTDGVLVAHLDSARGAIAYNFSDVWIQATIEAAIPGEGTWLLHDGTFAGRLRLQDSLASVEFVPDPDTGRSTTCTDSPTYEADKRRACALADIGYSSDDPSVPCDATSWAWKFEAEPAILANDVDPTRESDLPRCPPSLSPANDHCDTL